MKLRFAQVFVVLACLCTMYVTASNEDNCDEVINEVVEDVEYVDQDVAPVGGVEVLFNKIREEMEDAQVDTVSGNEQYNISDTDKDLLMRIAMAESGGEDTDGKAHVMMVVLNRVNSDKFPNTIYDVIYQKVNGVYQFAPIYDSRFDSVKPNEDCEEALNMVLNGWDESNGALYFESCKGESWHSKNLEYLFKHGGHRFYK